MGLEAPAVSGQVGSLIFFAMMLAGSVTINIARLVSQLNLPNDFTQLRPGQILVYKEANLFVS